MDTLSSSPELPRSKAWPMVVGLIIGVTLGIIGCWWYLEKHPTTSVTTYTAASQSTYSNAKYGYSFIYPNDKVVYNTETTNPTAADSSTSKVGVSKPGSGSYDFKFSPVGTGALDLPYLKSHYPDFNEQFDTVTQTTISGLSGYKIVNGGITDYYIQKDTSVYDLGVFGDAGRRVLDTFKFN